MKKKNLWINTAFFLLQNIINYTLYYTENMNHSSLSLSSNDWSSWSAMGAELLQLSPEHVSHVALQKIPTFQQLHAVLHHYLQLLKIILRSSSGAGVFFILIRYNDSPSVVHPQSEGEYLFSQPYLCLVVNSFNVFIYSIICQNKWWLFFSIAFGGCLYKWFVTHFLKKRWEIFDTI